MRDNEVELIERDSKNLIYIVELNPFTLKRHKINPEKLLDTELLNVKDELLRLYKKWLDDHPE